MKALKEIARWLGMVALAFAMAFLLWLTLWIADDLGFQM